MRWLKDFWWAGWNHKKVSTHLAAGTAQLAASTAQLRIYMNWLIACEKTLGVYSLEIRRLTQQTEHDALMLQAYANWCASKGCTPTRKDLELASGNK